MQSRTRSVVITTAILAAGLGLVAPPGAADDDKDKRSNAGAAFGRGLNTAQPGNPVNHVILPREIKIKTGGVVNFAVAGFHDIIIFKPGFKREDLDPFIPPSGTFIFPRDPAAPLPAQFDSIAGEVYCRGINPAGGPPPANPATGDPSNGSNRSEPVSFLARGTYLVICNVRPHLLDGMFAYVKVGDDD
jgi:plastocyanin